jgi:catechol 2,3-dioxygenase-like lactoylglutathione lyase family enzyme
LFFCDLTISPRSSAMENAYIDTIVDEFERGRLSRRQLVASLVGLGAATATFGGTACAQQSNEEQSRESDREEAQPEPSGSTFQATGLDHIALDVTDVARSREFYAKHLGLRVIRGDDRALFMGAERDFFLTLFRAERPRMHHYCYSIREFNADDAVQKLADAGLRPERTGNRVYFPDPDGLTVQITGR